MIGRIQILLTVEYARVDEGAYLGPLDGSQGVFET